VTRPKRKIRAPTQILNVVESSAGTRCFPRRFELSKTTTRRPGAGVHARQQVLQGLVQRGVDDVERRIVRSPLLSSILVRG